MKIIPAIDIYNNKAVRLYKGDYDKSTIYGEPVEIAKKFEEFGAKFIHVVDLNGAKEGKLSNILTIEQIVKNTNIGIEVGGGIREISDIKRLLNIGVNRVIIGSKALELEFLEEALTMFGSDKIVVGIDSDNLIIKTHGWLNDSNINAIDFVKSIKRLGVKTIIFTDIAKDGTLSGINIAQTKKMIDETKLDIIASGGAKTYDDINNAKKIGAKGIILGKSIYNKDIDLSYAIKEYQDAS